MVYDLFTLRLTLIFRTNVMTYRITSGHKHNGIHDVHDIKGHCQDIDMSIKGHTQILNTTFTTLKKHVRCVHILYIVTPILYTLYIVLLHSVGRVCLMAIVTT